MALHWSSAEQQGNDIEWHFIGHLQSNKVKYIAEYVSLIHSNDTYRVICSVRSKLSAGDTFLASFFALGHAAMLSNLVHGDHSFPLYEIGRQGGLTLVKLESPAIDR